MRKLLFISCLLLLSWPLLGQDSLDVNGRSALRLQELADRGQSLLYQRLPSFTSAWAGYTLEAQDAAFLPQEGRGLGEFLFRADARHRLSEDTALRGGASYRRGVKRDVFLNSSSDWELLYPYHTADTVGGDLQKEQYSFYGAYVHRFNRFFLGGEVKFRALHEYRAVDPRPRNITSDLEAYLQAGLEAGAYAYSLQLYARKYHQRQDMEFLDSRGFNTSILHMTGLGQHYGRFSGSGSSMDARFRGLGTGVDLQLEPIRGEGWFGLVHYGLQRYVRHIINQNEAPMTRLYVHDAQASGGWKNDELLWKALVSYQYRRGLEAVLDVKGAYLPLLELPIYGQHKWEARLEALRSWKGVSATWNLEPTLAFQSLDARYENPARSLSLQALEGGVKARRISQKGLWLSTLDASLGAHIHLGGGLSIPQEKTNEGLYTIYNNLYGRWVDHCFHLQLGGRVQRALSPSVALAFSLRAGGALYTSGHRSALLCAGIGLIF